MKKLKVTEIHSEHIVFNNGYILKSYHGSDCCEHHFLSFEDLELDDFKNLEFDLSNDMFFKRIKGYGIELIPTNGWSVKVAGYGSNNGYYSSDLELVLTDGNNTIRKYDITECQDYED